MANYSPITNNMHGLNVRAKINNTAEDSQLSVRIFDDLSDLTNIKYYVDDKSIVFIKDVKKYYQYNSNLTSWLEFTDIGVLSSVQVLDLTDAGNSTLHYHSSDRNRNNHTGTQTSSTIADFTVTVLATVLTGLSVLTGTTVVSTDSILIAIGKLQKQITDLTLIVSGKLAANTPITGASNKTKISFDGNGLITSGTDATTSDISSSTDRRYVTDAQLVEIGSLTTTYLPLSSISLLEAADLTSGINSVSHFHNTDRDRSNHTGTQSATTIDNFASTVRATILTGISFLTGTDITSSDSVLSAFGKLQKQLSDMAITVGNLSSSVSGKLTANTPITGATHSKITYDLNGLVTSGADATTADISDSLDKRYVTDAELSVLGNFSSNVRSTILTGVSFLVGTAIVATDSILTAMGKLQKQITDLTISKQDTLFSTTNIKSINGSSILGSGDLVVTGTLGATLQSNPTDPTTTTSTIGVMMGLAGSITPTKSGKILIVISGDIDVTGNGNGAQVRMYTGTGTAPTNGAALIGTSRGGLKKITNPGNNVMRTNFTCNFMLTGLTLNTAIWIDLSLAAITGGTARIRDIDISAMEQ